MGNHVIRFELLSALLHSNLCCSGPTIFCRNLSEQFCQRLPLAFFIALIHTWSQIYSRFAAFLAPLHPISRGRLRASKPAWIKSSVNLSYLVVFLYKIVRALSAQPEVFLLASLARRLPTRSGFCSVRAMSWETVPHSGRQT